MKTWLCMVLLTLNCVSAFAGREGGNGGDIVVCFNQPVFASGEPAIPGLGMPKVIRAALLDHWEWKNSPYRLNMGATRLTYYDKVKNVIGAIRAKNEDYGKRLQDRFRTFFQDSELVAEKDLPEVYDANYAPIEEENCYVKQFAVQYDYAAGAQTRKKYLINRDIFNQPWVSEDTKAGLVLHEIAYAEAKHTQNVQNSDRVRPLNFLLSSTKMREISDVLLFANLLASYGVDPGRPVLSFSHHFSKAETIEIGHQVSKLRLGAPLELLSSDFDFQDFWIPRSKARLKLEPGSRIQVVYVNGEWKIHSFDFLILQRGSEILDLNGISGFNARFTESCALKNHGRRLWVEGVGCALQIKGQGSQFTINEGYLDMDDVTRDSVLTNFSFTLIAGDHSFYLPRHNTSFSVHMPPNSTMQMKAYGNDIEFDYVEVSGSTITIFGRTYPILNQLHCDHLTQACNLLMTAPIK